MVISDVYQLISNPLACEHGGFLNTGLFNMDVCYSHVIISPFHNFKESDAITAEK